MHTKLVKAMAELNEDIVIEEVRSLIKSNVSPLDIVGYLQKGIEIVGLKFEKKEYFMSELIISGEIFKEASKILGKIVPSSTSKSGTSNYGNFVIGTIRGDIHDVGKNIVSTFMSSNNFSVIDLGVDVPSEKYIDAIIEYKPKVIAISCLLTNCFDNVRECIKSIEDLGLRKKVKIIVGGGALDQDSCKYVKADIVCKTAQQTVEYCKEIYDIHQKEPYLRIVR